MDGYSIAAATENDREYFIQSRKIKTSIKFKFCLFAYQLNTLLDLPKISVSEVRNLVKVVCGAKNARDGLFAVYAPPGAVIPKTNMKLKIAKIRGIESYGMLCSGYELDESSDQEGIIELDKKEKNVGEKYFKNIGEKTIDISITPNRPDWLGVRGIARDRKSVV